MSRAPVDASPAIPVTIVTGFLGSGKTTMLAHLLRQPELSDAAVIVNELGEVGLDHLLVQGPGDETVLLDSGCICCTMRGDLVVTLQELMARRMTGEVPPFGHVLVETTGMADPVPLVQTLVEDADVIRWFALGGVVTMVDARNGESQLDRHFQSVKQAALADRLLISKTDLVEPGTLRRLEARLRELNPGALIFAVRDGKVAPQDIIDAGRQNTGRPMGDWLGAAARDIASNCSDGHGGEPHAHHHHDDGVLTFSVRHEAPVHPAGLKLWLDLVSVFQGPNLLRVKGLVNVAGRPVFINLVQHVSHPPVELDGWPDDDRASRLVFITRDIDRAAIETTFAAFDFEPAPAPAAHQINPDNYARFRHVLDRFHGAS